MCHTCGPCTCDLSQFLSPDNTLAILRNPFGNLKGFITCMIGTRLPVHMSVRSTREFRKWDFAHSQASHFVRRRRDYRNHNAWEILKEHGYSVVLYHCPLAALRCDLTIFDLAILDFQMPGLNGCELFLRMRASGAEFPMLLLTGCADVLSYEDRALFSRCLNKAAPIRQLLETITISRCQSKFLIVPPGSR